MVQPHHLAIGRPLVASERKSHIPSSRLHRQIHFIRNLDGASRFLFDLFVGVFFLMAEKNQTEMLLLCWERRREQLRNLLTQPATHEVTTGHYPLHVAVNYGNEEALRVLLQVIPTP